jgi:hypothetical protein
MIDLKFFERCAYIVPPDMPVEVIQKLLDNLIVISALLLGFTMTFSAAFKHDEFVAADSRLPFIIFHFPDS